MSGRNTLKQLKEIFEIQGWEECDCEGWFELNRRQKGFQQIYVGTSVQTDIIDILSQVISELLFQWEAIAEMELLSNVLNCYNFYMTEESEILDLSSYSPSEIFETIQKLMEESDFEKFTLVLKRKPKQGELLSASKKPNKKLKTKYSTNILSKGSSSDMSFRYQIPNSSRYDPDEEMDDNYHVGLRLYNQGDYEAAMELFHEQEQELTSSLREGVNTVKNYHDICFYLGNCFYRLKHYEKAINYFQKKFQDEQLKQKGQKYNNLGSCYAHLDQLRQSLNYYSEAFKIYEKFPEIDSSNLLNNLGMLYAQSGMYQTAQKYFNQSIEQRKLKSPNSHFPMYCSYLQLGNAQKHSNKLQDAIVSLQNALTISESGYGDSAQTLIQLAGIYEKCERWSDALNCYEKLTLYQTSKGFLYEKAALLHRNMGRYSDYDRFIKQAYEEYMSEKDDRKICELRPMVQRLSGK